MGEHAGAGGWGFIRGGMGTITQAIASYGKSKGLEIRTNAEVISIDSSVISKGTELTQQHSR